MDIRKIKDQMIEWIREYFKNNGNPVAVIGISGGTDSSVAAAILKEAIGAENVIGVMIPNGHQHDIDVSEALVKHLGIRSHTVNIKEVTTAINTAVKEGTGLEVSDNDCYMTNTPARIRMSVLYGVAALYGNSRVINTCNLSEDYVGYSTKFGDSAGDVGFLSALTKTEVKELGRLLNLPSMFVDKIPEDGMSGKSDEEKLGFTYAMLDHYIRTGEIDNEAIKNKIDRMNRANLHKLNPMPVYRIKED